MDQKQSPVPFQSTSNEYDSVYYSPVPVPVPSSSVVPNKAQSSYPGVRKMSKLGRKEVLIYHIPGTGLAYSFQYHRTNKNCECYVCSRCKTHRVNNSIKVIGDNFQTDPAALPHICEPQNASQEEALRIGYLVKQQIKNTPVKEHKKPMEIWKEVLTKIETNPALDEEQRKMVAEKWKEGGVMRQRSSLSRAVNAQFRVPVMPPAEKRPKKRRRVSPVSVIDLMPPRSGDTEPEATLEPTPIEGSSFPADITLDVFEEKPSVLSDNAPQELNEVDPCEDITLWEDVQPKDEPTVTEETCSSAESEKTDSAEPEPEPSTSAESNQPVTFPTAQSGYTIPKDVNLMDFACAVGLHTLFSPGTEFKFEQWKHFINR